jgi:Zn-dependent metalloprotease
MLIIVVSDAFNNTNKDNGLTHIGVLKTYDYFSAIHQRNSFDNAGAAKLCPFDNALTMPTGTVVMTYGDGDGQLLMF